MLWFQKVKYESTRDNCECLIQIIQLLNKNGMHIFDSISNNSSTMPVFTAFIKLCLVISGISSLDIYRSPRAFCYDRPHCDFSTSEWPELCQVGKKQSPIDLVTQKESELVLKLPVSHFRADHFFLQNNGHTLNLDLTSKDKVMFPIENEGDMQYKLYNVHFHWGKDDTVRQSSVSI